METVKKIQRSLFIVILLAFLPRVVSAQTNTGISKRVKCISDTSQQYALYVPGNYVPEKITPLLIFLDPAARGAYPVDKYHELADEYGIIIAGSYNSSNFNAGSSVGSFVAIYNDVVARYAIDPAKIWISGFSGGARAATSIAMNYPEVKAVIGCGAGFANDEIPVIKLKEYAAIVGDRDMNYTELLDNSTYLDEKKVNNILLTFNGGHDWPPVERFGLAIEWLLRNDENTSSYPTNNGDHFRKAALAKLDSGFLYLAWLDLQQLSKIPAFKKNADSLIIQIESKKEFAKDQKTFKQVTIEEQDLINEFSIAFTLTQSQKKPGDKNIWLQNVRSIDKMKKDANRYRQMAGKRCLDHCTRSCLENYFRFLNSADYETAFTAAVVLSYFEPKDPESYYYIARAKGGAGDKKQCIKWLKESVKNGLKLNNRILQDSLLLKVLDVNEIKDLVGKN